MFTSHRCLSLPQTLPVEGPITIASTATIFILIMASMGRSGRNAPLCCSHGRTFSPTFACLPPSHSPGLQSSKEQKSPPRSKRRSHARTWLFRPPYFRTVRNASSDCNRSWYRVAKRPTGWPVFVPSGHGSALIYPYTFPHCWCLGDREMLQEARGLVPDGVRVLLVEAESKLMELKSRGARADGASDKLGQQQPPAPP